jgi:hypothetical protein
MTRVMCRPWKRTFTLAPLFPLNVNSPYKQNLPWPKNLTNYLDDNQLCIIDIVPRLD